MIVILKARPRAPVPLDAREAAVARALVAASRAVSAATPLGKLREALEAADPMRAIDVVAWEAAGEALLATLPKQYVLQHRESKERADRQMRRALRKQLGYEFGREDPNSVRWAQTRSGDLIREWGSTSQAALRTMINRAFEDGLPPRQIARLIRDSGIGLTERQALAVVRRREQLIKDGIQASRVDGLTERYSAQLLRQRAATIARTEIIAAQTAGTQATWQQAVEQGFLNLETARQVWAADPDERTCPICESLDGEEARLGEPFPGGYYGPPAHPACRCGVNLRP